MKDKREFAGIGIIDLDKCTLMESIDLFINIKHLSESLEGPVQKAVERGKKQFCDDYAVLMKRKNLHWSDKGLNIIPQLHISMSSSLEHKRYFKCELIAFVEDKENEELSTSVDVNVDLSQHRKEMEKIMINAFLSESLKLS